MAAMSRALTLLFAATLSYGQWINEPARGVPRTPDGKPNLTAPARRMNGKPDFTGIWQTDMAAPGEIEKIIPTIAFSAVPGDDPRTFSRYLFNVMADYPPNDIKLSQDGQKAWDVNRSLGDSVGPRCLPNGLPMTELFPLPRRIVQTPALVAVLYEGDLPRQIHLDGRKLPADPNPAWTGYSVAKWDGDTLVVETVGLNSRAFLDAFAHPRSDAMRMLERWQRRDFGHLEIQVTIEDAKYYSKPITFRYTSTLIPDDDLLEWVCTENEKDKGHIK
jgi:hypothetical protein